MDRNPVQVSEDRHASLVEFHSESLLETLRMRYGFHWTPSRGGYKSAMELGEAECGLIGFALGNTFDLAEEYVAPAVDFYKVAITAAKTRAGKGETANMERPPANLWDLDSEEKAFHNKYPGYIVYAASLNQALFFFFDPDAKSEVGIGAKWTVAISSATTALECIRRGIHKRDEIVRFFLGRGIPFNTFVNYKRPAAGSSCVSGVQLNFRPPGYKPNAADYAAYVAARDKFLRGPRGRIALMQGGILWRLAVDVVRIDAVLAGPSDEAHVHTLATNPRYVDDQLTADEIHLICGVYRVYTGYGTQVSELSWWPKPSAWDLGGMNMGYWTPNAESWFKRRLEKIEKNEAELRSASQWGHVCKFHHGSRKFKEVNELWAMNFIFGFSCV